MKRFIERIETRTHLNGDPIAIELVGEVDATTGHIAVEATLPGPATSSVDIEFALIDNGPGGSQDVSVGSMRLLPGEHFERVLFPLPSNAETTVRPTRMVAIVRDSDTSQVEIILLRADWHHLLPQAVFGDSLGMIMHFKEFGLLLNNDLHSRLHAAGWNAAWDHWLNVEMGGNATLDQIRAKLASLKSDPRFADILSRGIEPPVDYSPGWRGQLPEQYIRFVDRLVDSMATPGLVGEALERVKQFARLSGQVALGILPVAVGLLDGLEIGAATVESQAFQGFINQGMFAIDQARDGVRGDVDIRGTRYQEVREQVVADWGRLGFTGADAGQQMIDQLATLMESIRDASWHGGQQP